MRWSRNFLSVVMDIKREYDHKWKIIISLPSFQYISKEKGSSIWGELWCLDKLNAKFCFMIYLVMFVEDCFHSACWSTYVCGWCEHQAIIGIYPNQCNTVNTLVQHCNWRRAHQFKNHSQIRGYENYFFFA